MTTNGLVSCPSSITIQSGSIAGFAQNTSDTHITGYIMNKNTKEYLPLIDVSLKGTTIGTTTDATGHYFLKNLFFCFLLNQHFLW